MQHALATTAVEDHVATITLNEPEKRNPLSPRLVADVTRALEELQDRDDVSAVVITGAGPVFCAGADLRGMRSLPPLEDRREYDRILKLNRLVWSYPLPTIAAVNGHALGAGANLVCWCDLAVAAESAEFGYPEVKAGIPSATVIASLLRVVSRKEMFRLVLTGERISAEQALGMGLVNTVVPDGDVLEAAHRLARSIVVHSPDALRFTKDVANTIGDMQYEKALAYGRDVRVLSRLSPRFRDAIEAHTSKMGG